MSLTACLRIVAATLLLTACQTTPPAPLPPLQQQFRFLLTFDDGPSTATDNSKLAILAQLANNDIHPGIKGSFSYRHTTAMAAAARLGEGCRGV